MKHVVFPASSQERRLPFYLAAEEWVARALPADDYFFTWIVQPTVIFGRNQQIDTEVNLDYCRRHGIQTYRRRSGGGCVYADTHNIMMSYVSAATDVATTFAGYTGMVAEMLRALGLDAHASGRNDVLIGDRKVSGNAFYHLPGRSIVHGTMLYSTDIENMLHAITPSRSKLESKQVQSVASHITTISQHLPDLSLEAFHNHIIDFICSGDTIVLNAEQAAEIEVIEQHYYKPEWLLGRKSASRRCRRIEGAGEITAEVDLNSDGLIDSVNLLGDFFVLSDLDSGLLQRVAGVAPEPMALRAALSDTDASKVVAGLSTDDFINLITN